MALDEEERALLLSLLEQASGETRVEVHHTHTPDYRAQVQHSEGLLAKMIEKIRHPSS